MEIRVEIDPTKPGWQITVHGAGSLMAVVNGRSVVCHAGDTITLPNLVEMTQ
jgi:hypothetical protein